MNIIIDQDKEKNIENKLKKMKKKKNLKLNINEKLLDEVVNIVEKPKLLCAQFDKKFLNIPKEINYTMQTSSKIFSNT